ncbi:phosphotransferase family protein [Neolewinella lacunae]|uniref:Phosphotransferase family protein n=1 Tax=Neolewinella lacunae TaxID=1517758 RepID=A0A923T8G4_9BACT|nr:phosphotransferase family protein [Neolewinella lacunae]MBC6994541.1 phosphotransferase family protein [Neolewinella lacunae]MDN3634234.1 phosphotransferase family protein [Neolewinella lacunae]
MQTDYDSIRPGENLDWGKLENYLRQHLPGAEGPFSVGQFRGGHANLTYLLRFGEREFVLRRPPFGTIPPGAHDMQREYRVLRGLHPFFPPAPQAYLLGTDHAVIGADFVVVERRSGVVIRQGLPECFVGVDRAPERLTDALMRVCADLHAVDPYAAGLETLGKPEGFVARQLSGWLKRWDLAKLEENDDIEWLRAELPKDIPDPQRVSVVHGDLKFDNCQFQPNDPDRVTAVFDWDMATLGDPLVDLAGLLSFWPDPALDGADLPVAHQQGDWPNKEYLRSRYAAYSGLDLRRMPWYEAFAFLKTAVIAQQLYARYVAGATKDERMEKFGPAARTFAKLGRMRLSA